MSPINANDLEINKELYEALMKKDDQTVLEICAGIPKGPLHTVTIHDDTVIHIAVYHKKTALALSLLEMVHDCDSHKLTWQNSSGSTILHETGTNNKTVAAAKEMLRRAPMLLSMTNRQGETPLFYAARHGKTKIFKFLHDEVTRTNQGPDLKTFLIRDDKSTILHLAILSRNYWMSHEIAVRHKHLIAEKDEDEMTPLQLLSCRPLDISSANFFKRLVYNAIDPNVDDTSRMLSPLKKMRKEKFKSEWAMKLIKLLVKEDTSWEKTESRLGKHRAKFHQYGKNSSATQLEEIAESLARLPHTPLLLATKYGCTQVVEEILEFYPQAIEHIDQDGRNILHIAILYRNHKVFDLVVNTKYAKERLRGKIDNDANTLLHMVGEEAADVKADIKDPAHALQDNMKLFKKVANICTTLDSMKLNSKSKTAEQLFNENNNQRRTEAKEWMIENAKNYTVVAVLIATVAFAAEYTVPGGPDKSGQPVLKEKPLFFVFTIADAASLSAALTAVIMFLNIITSTYRFKDFETRIILKLNFGLFLLMVSVAMMMVAFAATLVLTISSGRKWTDITLYVISFFPVIVFLYTYFQRSIDFSSIHGKIKDMRNYMHSWFKNPKPSVWHPVSQRTTDRPPAYT
ncbi:ankyrin repeat-containing domain, PGG domain protein [Artemisia annua]|uniref:Ankyrin repeat-containing domain, PGG domain protein n=1 Tax=Artemisia annua TaxID=35608 RepID=A0A2U1L0Z8_ARTAN|nr:ankyrin repeat-containing domain, PGG domain protein [Artemisia annua]